jgi:hypothetical protein
MIEVEYEIIHLPLMKMSKWEFLIEVYVFGDKTKTRIVYFL